ncbi:hypothetical protein ES703_19431 [subsurface metagenome]
MLEGVAKRILRAALGGGGTTNIDLPGEFATLVLALKTAMEAAIDTGTATGGSNTTIIDTGASWATNMWEDATFEVEIGAKRYLGIVISNTATTITFAALADSAAVVSGCKYGLKRPVDIADISDRAARLLGVVDSLTKWGGTALTGRDISLDLKALTDISITGILKSIGDIAAAESLIVRIGAIADAEVVAGATGSMSAKLRRLTDDLNALITAVGLLPQLATTPVIYNVTMTNLDTQYSQALPANTKKYTIQTRDGTAFRMAFVTGKVAAPTEPYFSIGTDGFHHEDLINPAAVTLYFACDEAAKVVEIIAWS